MTDDDILRRLREVRYSSKDDRLKKRALSFSDIARDTGISRDHLERIANDRMNIGPKTRTALRQYFVSDCKDGVRFHRHPDPSVPANPSNPAKRNPR
jgi:hypothetical protein